LFHIDTVKIIPPNESTTAQGNASHRFVKQMAESRRRRIPMRKYGSSPESTMKGGQLVTGQNPLDLET